MLRELRKMDIRLGVVTNGLVRFQMPYLRALGWDFLFDAIVGPDVAGFAKPHQGILTPLSPGIAHIGDRLTHDVLVAHRADRLGILVGVPTPESDRIDPLCPAQITPDYIINDYYALAPLIRHLRESWFPPGG
jgi:putative hydrolase of the HAD superfamily